jgi:hypothetical protein
MISRIKFEKYGVKKLDRCEISPALLGVFFYCIETKLLNLFPISQSRIHLVTTVLANSISVRPIRRK